jgi:single-strand DNA-binding protein
MIRLDVIGNLTRDCVVNNVNGKMVLNFTVGHNEKYKDKNGAIVNKPTFVDCAWWTDRTGIAPYLKKGVQIFATGQPEVRQYQTQDGKQGASLTIRVGNVQLLGSSQKDSQQQGQQVSSVANMANTMGTHSTDFAPSAGDITEPLDDLPF